jgi:hypothetical protein
MDLITLNIAATTSAKTLYIPAPVRCVVNSMAIAVSSAVGGSKAFIVGKGTAPQATASTNGTPAAGDTYSAEINAADIFEKGDALKVTIPAVTTAGNVSMVIRLDPFLSGVPGA